MIEVLDRIRQAGGTVEVVGGDLRLRIPKGLLSAAERSILAAQKAEIVRLLADEPVVETTPIVVGTGTGANPIQNGYETPSNSHQGTGGNDRITVAGNTIEPDLDEEVVVPPPPCQQCGGFLFWWDLSGRPHCSNCEPADRSEKLRRRAERLRRQAKRG
jgi:hypothetical protein